MNLKTLSAASQLRTGDLKDAAACLSLSSLEQLTTENALRLVVAAVLLQSGFSNEGVATVVRKAESPLRQWLGRFRVDLRSPQAAVTVSVDLGNLPERLGRLNELPSTAYSADGTALPG